MPRADRVTMQDVARLAGVTARTVSNVVNDYPFVKDETRKKVWDAVHQLGYTMNYSARGLRQGNMRLIALAVPDLTMPYFADLADAVIAHAHNRGMRATIEPTASSRQREREILHGIDGLYADGLIYCPLDIAPAEMLTITPNFPIVVLSEPTHDSEYDYVTIRNRDAACAATEALIRGGSRRIAAIGLGADQAVGTANERLLGYRDALVKHGITPDPALEVATNSWHRPEGIAAVEQLLDRGTTFDGVFAFTDQIATGALYALQLHGKRIPADVAVIGFDNNDESRYLSPTLSTIDPGVDDIAEQAVDILIRRIANDDSAPIHHIVDFSLIERQSTRPTDTATISQ